MNHIIRILLAILALSLFGCGGGGNGGSERISLSGVGVTLILPAGVTVRTNADGSAASGVVVASGVAEGNSSAVSVYNAASGSTPATLVITVASTAASGFG